MLNLANAPEGLAPPDYHGMSPEEYLGYLRAAYRTNPRPFLRLVRDARDRGLTLVSVDRPDLVQALYGGLVGVAARRGWDIGGGQRA